MTDPIRDALERAARELERAGDELMMADCLNLGGRAKNEAHAARAALAAPTPEPDTDAVLGLAAIIREVDGSHSLGAAALAEAILAHPAAREMFAAPTLPADPDALAARPLLEEVAAIEAYGRGPLPPLIERVRQWLDANPPGQPVAIEPRGCPTPGACSCVQPVAPTLPVDGEAEARPQSTTAAVPADETEPQWLGGVAIPNGDRWMVTQVQPCGEVLTRGMTVEKSLAVTANRFSPVWLPDVSLIGMAPVGYNAGNGVLIQLTHWDPRAWAIRCGASCMSHTGEWEIEPQPSNRTHEWLATHRWPTVAAAWEALQRSRREETTNG